MTDLVERARALALAIDFSPDDLGGEIGTASLRNPDGKELLSIVEALSERIAVLESALTPSAETKAAYMGEFSFAVEIAHPRLGSERRSVDVPWTAIKEIMAAIRSRSSLTQEPQ